MKDFTLKINGKEIFIDDIQTAIDLVEATYGTCDVIFGDNRGGVPWTRRIEDAYDFQELLDEYKEEL